MGKIDGQRREARLRAIGMKGKLPDVLSETVLEAVRTHPLGEVYTLADGKVPGLALDVGTEGAATYWLNFRTHAGIRRRLKIATAGAVTLKTARDLAMAALAAVGRGDDPAQARKEARSAAQTVREYLENVYAPKVLQHAKGGDDTKARILAAWEPILGRPIAQISRDAIELVLAVRKDDGLKAGTLLRDWSAFRAMLADAVDRGHLAAIPMTRRPEPIRKLHGNKRIRYLGEKDNEDTKPDVGECARFDKALAAFTSDEPGGGDFLRCAAGLALATGMRRGEIVRLADKLINKRERRIDLTPEITKSNKARIVYLSDAALAALKLWTIRGKGGELFPSSMFDDKPDAEEAAERCEDRITQREWPRLCAAARLEDFHFHDLRHTFAARLVMAGRPLIEVRDALGHASIVMTERYAHLAPSAVREAVLGIGRRVS
jgi:integrase